MRAITLSGCCAGSGVRFLLEAWCGVHIALWSLSRLLFALWLHVVHDRDYDDAAELEIM